LVVVTQIEHANRDGSPMLGAERWQSKRPAPDLLFGLLRSGQVTPRRLVGWHDLATISEQPEPAWQQLDNSAVQLSGLWT
jgi:hypothetical protein